MGQPNYRTRFFEESNTVINSGDISRIIALAISSNELLKCLRVIIGRTAFIDSGRNVWPSNP
jgi:hypothetical protein